MPLLGGSDETVFIGLEFEHGDLGVVDELRGDCPAVEIPEFFGAAGNVLLCLDGRELIVVSFS